MAKRKKLDISTVEKTTPYLKELDQQSDRGCALVAAAILETHLQHVLEAFFVEGNWDGLFEPNQPLAGFSNKIEIAAALGIIGGVEQEELHHIRKIRNEFAHNLDCRHFTDAPVAAMAGRLLGTPSNLRMRAQKTATVRENFMIAFLIAAGGLTGRMGSIKRMETPKDQLRKLLE